MKKFPGEKRFQTKNKREYEVHVGVNDDGYNDDDDGRKTQEQSRSDKAHGRWSLDTHGRWRWPKEVMDDGFIKLQKCVGLYE